MSKTNWRTATLALAFAPAFACLLVAPTLGRELDKGHQILIDRGLQLQAICWGDNFAGSLTQFHLSRFQSANFTTVNWTGLSHNAELGAAPGVPWARWSVAESEVDLTSAEQAYKANLVALQRGDEQPLDDPVVRDGVVNWFNTVRGTFANTLLYTNQGPDVPVSNAAMQDYMTRAQPDMLSYDRYPFLSNGPTGGSPTTLYADLQRYRTLSLGGNDHTGSRPIPFGFYTQTFHSYGTNAPFRTPSDSEMRLNHFAVWTFGGKFTNAFSYNIGDTTLFPDGNDAAPTQRFTELAETNRQSRNLGPALVRLLSTDVRFIAGLAPSVRGNPTPAGVQNWVAGASDPYMTSIAANNLGGFNAGLRGDVLVGYFRVLDESFDGPAFEDEIYFMLTNGLSDFAGSSSQTRQRITVHFDFGSTDITSLQRLSRLTGQIEDVPLTPLGRSIYRLVLDLDGGTGDLFKFNTGAPFVGVPEPSLTALLLAPAALFLRRRHFDRA